MELLSIRHGKKAGQYVVTFDIDGVKNGPSLISDRLARNATGRKLMAAINKHIEDGKEIQPAQDLKAVVSSAEKDFEKYEKLRIERFDDKKTQITDLIKKINPKASDEDAAALAELLMNK